MKQTTILFLLLANLQLLAQQEPIPPSRTFKVCDVVPAEKLLNTTTYEDAIFEKVVNQKNIKERVTAIQNDSTLTPQEKRDKIKNKSYMPEGIPIRKIEASASKELRMVKTRFHPFMQALHTAYRAHYSFTISPDMIWLLIAQGFAKHVEQNPEEMREYFVNFEGKMQLDVRKDNFKKGSPDNDWEAVFEEFGKQIEANTGPELLELITGSFSTTTAVEKVAFQITLMDAMKSYFKYSVSTMCGIPEIRIEGTVEDWEAIEQKTKLLAQYDLEWWTKELQPILKEFTKAAKGEENPEFWKSIYKWHGVSGAPYITGWILNFFPYKKQGEKFVQFIGNPKEITTRRGKEVGLMATTRNLTSGLSQAPFIWNYIGTFYDMEFIAGFIGFSQDKDTKALRPEIGWAVVDLQRKPAQEDIDAYWKGGDEQYLQGEEKKVEKQ